MIAFAGMTLLVVVTETGLTVHAIWAALVDLVEAGHLPIEEHLGQPPPLPRGVRRGGSVTVTPTDPSPLDPAALPELLARLLPSPTLSAVMDRWQRELLSLPADGPPLRRDECLLAAGAAVGLLSVGAHRIAATPLPRPAHLDPMKQVLVAWQVPVAPAREGVVTPEALALLRALQAGFELPGSLRAQRIGTGADGSCRVSLWEAGGEGWSEVSLVETHLDDMQPEFYGHLGETLLQAGALDVWLVPVLMKKGRPGTWIQVLCQPEDTDRFVHLLFRETTTLGVRTQRLQRQALARSLQVVSTDYGPVRVKVATGSEGLWKAAPEYDDCRRQAIERGVPLREVYQAAQVAARRLRHQQDATQERFESHEERDPHQPRRARDPGCDPGRRDPG